METTCIITNFIETPIFSKTKIAVIINNKEFLLAGNKESLKVYYELHVKLMPDFNYNSITDKFDLDLRPYKDLFKKAIDFYIN